MKLAMSWEGRQGTFVVVSTMLAFVLLLWVMWHVVDVIDVVVVMWLWNVAEALVLVVV